MYRGMIPVRVDSKRIEYCTSWYTIYVSVDIIIGNPLARCLLTIHRNISQLYVDLSFCVVVRACLRAPMPI